MVTRWSGEHCASGQRALEYSIQEGDKHYRARRAFKELNMRTSTGLLCILIAALLAALSIPSPTRFSGWRALQNPAITVHNQIALHLQTENSKWLPSDTDIVKIPGYLRVIQAWLFWPLDMLRYLP